MKRLKLFILLVLAILISLPAFSADKIDSKIRFNDFYGEVKIRPNAEEDDSYEFVDLDTVIYEDDRIKTEEDSGAILGLEDMSTYVIKPESTLIIHTEEGNVSKIEMIAGTMWANFKKMAEGKTLEVEMSQCVCGIEGTSVLFQSSGTDEGEGEERKTVKPTKKGAKKLPVKTKKSPYKKLTKKQQKKLKKQIRKTVGKLEKVTVLNGKVIVTNRVTLQKTTVPAGHQAEINGQEITVKPIVNLNEVKKDLQSELDKANDKLDIDKLINKLNQQTEQINKTKNKLDSILDEAKEQEAKAKNRDTLKQIAKQVEATVKEGNRLTSIFIEVESTIKVLESKMTANKKLNSFATEKEVIDYDGAKKAIREAKIAMINYSQSLKALSDYASELNNKLNGDNPAITGISSSESEQLFAEINKEINDIKTKSNNIAESLNDESVSYDNFQTAILECKELLSDLENIYKDINPKEVASYAEQLTKDYKEAKERIEEQILAYSSVPEVKGGTLEQMSKFNTSITNIAQEIRDYLKQYNAMLAAGTDDKKRYVETVTRILTSYDRMRRNYTKAERLKIQTEKDFSGSSYKTSEYKEIQDSWDVISDAMSNLDRDASELSSCVEALKSQLESLLGQ